MALPETAALSLARELRRRLENQLGARLKEVRIFGSRARGDALPESDLDVFVLVDRLDRDTRHLVVDTATDLCLETGHILDLKPMVMDVEEFGRLLSRERRLPRDVLEEGIPV